MYSRRSEPYLMGCRVRRATNTPREANSYPTCHQDRLSLPCAEIIVPKPDVAVQSAHGARGIAGGRVRLFTLGDGLAVEIAPRALDYERDLQGLVEANMPALLGARFLASEYSTGPAHGGRIDSLGIDENGAPVVVEYKRGRDPGVITQGLYYLAWLTDHRAEFEAPGPRPPRCCGRVPSGVERAEADLRGGGLQPLRPARGR